MRTRLDDEEIGKRAGIEINVSLPHQKSKRVDALSGGSARSLSIALLFAMPK